MPQRLELWQVFNPHLSVRGKMIYQEDFKSNAKYDPEQANELANKIWATAQHDCNCAERKSFYEIAVVDHNRTAQPLIHRIGPLFFSTTYLEKPGGNGARDDEDDDEYPSGLRSKAERYIERMLKHIEWKEQSLNAVTGDLLMARRDEAISMREWVALLMKGNMENFLATQSALDRRKERDLAGAWTEMKVETAREGMRMARNLLTGFGGAVVSGTPPSEVTKAIVDNVKLRIAQNTERTMIANFLRDCEQQGVFAKLFGEWTDDGPVAEKPGIFTWEQGAILIQVRDGDLPVEAVDEIITGFGGKFEIKHEQLFAAQPFVSQGTGQALIELKEIRERKRAAATPQTSESK